MSHAGLRWICRAMYVNARNDPAEMRRMSVGSIYPCTELRRQQLPMIRRLQPHTIVIRLFLLSMVFAAVPYHVPANEVLGAIPENASSTKYGSGWLCDRGHREVSGKCIALNLPANAYPTYESYGRGWECNRGYRKEGKTCVEVKIPQNAYLDSPAGHRWKCDRGYRAVNEACVKIKVPRNGYLSDSAYGSGWKCDRGFQAVEETCLALELPANAHIDYSGNDWACNRPYRKQHGKCGLR